MASLVNDTSTDYKNLNKKCLSKLKITDSCAMQPLQLRSPKQIVGKLAQLVRKVYAGNVVNRIHRYPMESLVLLTLTYWIVINLRSG